MNISIAPALGWRSIIQQALFKSVQGFNTIQENQPGIAAIQRGPTATNAFEIGKKLSRAMLGKHCLDAGFGQFFNILEQTCFKRGVFFQKVDAKNTSPICPNCLNETGKKELSERVNLCHNCGYTTDRDVAAAQVVLKRGLAAVGHTACDAPPASKFMGIPAKQESPRL